jgi:hypothetical protein
MNIRQRILAIIISSGLIFIVLDLVRRKKLKENYSLLWCAMCVSFILLALRPISFDDYVSRILGVSQAPNLLFLAAVIFLIVISIHYSVRVSALVEQNKTLAQDLALLRRDLSESGKINP